ncbi:MAG TPA: DNA photolyase [Candidatus Desulfofervidus auxilii]|uniref:DNA photolyase n=1 Tax=Desulfofervidus auxilii TaxID=1621989 RepID=A0A7C0U4D6_DESA2|nr:DNA photolyase [Candidatus Desulfofervidus auxilii]
MEGGLKKFFPKKILIDKTVLDLPYTQEILKRISHIPQEVVAPETVKGEVYNKEILYLTRNKGRFFRPCPCTNKTFYISCEYYILEVGTNCAFDCTYCILQSYLNQPFIQVYVNLEDLFKELDDIKIKFYRVGTGELTDSLFLDHITQLSRYLVPYFARRDNLILELKTKSIIIDNLADLDHNGHTVISWSLNAPEIVLKEEKDTPTLEERLKAAHRCQEWGYWIGFHFDPIIYYPGWKEGYKEAVDLIFKYIQPEKIAWISLGTFRFMPSLKNIIRHRFPESKIIYGEFISGLDGKQRYFKPIRILLYKTILKWIREYAPQVNVYLCMERPEIWKEVFGYVPIKGALREMLNNIFKKN